MSFYTFMPTLLNMSLTASVAIVLVILLRLLLKKAPKVISYVLWGVVLFRLLCPVSIGSDFSVYNLFDAPTEESGTVTSVIEYVPSNIVHTEYPSVALPVPGVSDAINEALPQGEEQLRADPLEGPIFIATYVWMAGVLAMVIYSIVSYIRLRRKLSVVVPLRDNIFIADDIKSPFVVGLFRPKIYLPCNLGDKEQEYIILHEQHHIKRLDHVMKALAFLALAIHWFNPLVWVAFILAGKDMEMSCDEAVIRKIGGDVRADYSASLLTLATGRRIIAGTPLAFGEGDTKGRINNLSNWKKPTFWVVLVAIIACVVLAVGLLTNPATSVDERLAVFLDCEIASYHQTKYSKDNFCCLDWEVIGKETNGEMTTVYMWVMYKEFANEDGLTLKTGAHIFTAITAERIDGNYRLVEYWQPDDGSYHADSIKEKVPMYLWGKAMNSQRYVDKQSAKLEKLAKEHFGSATSDHGGNDASAIATEVIPGTTYVSWQCLYMNPLSSYAAMGGDSGYKYVISDRSFTILNRNNGNVVSINSRPNVDTSESTPVSYETDIEKWSWQEFPYTDEEWAALYVPGGFGAMKGISQLYDEILYQPIEKNRFLLRVDGDLWLVELKNNPQMGTYLWSIYSLVPESAMGVAQWELTNYSSRLLA